MATRFFTVMPRQISVQYFEDDPVVVDFRIDDGNDNTMRSAITDTDKKATGNVKKHKEIFAGMVGGAKAEAILSRIDEPDCYVLDQLIVYTARTYLENRQKNLNAAATGKIK